MSKSIYKYVKIDVNSISESTINIPLSVKFLRQIYKIKHQKKMSILKS